MFDSLPCWKIQALTDMWDTLSKSNRQMAVCYVVSTAKRAAAAGVLYIYILKISCFLNWLGFTACLTAPADAFNHLQLTKIATTSICCSCLCASRQSQELTCLTRVHVCKCWLWFLCMYGHIFDAGGGACLDRKLIPPQRQLSQSERQKTGMSWGSERERGKKDEFDSRQQMPN